MFYRLRYPMYVVTQVITLVTFDCPLQAIVGDFGVDDFIVRLMSQGRQCGLCCPLPTCNEGLTAHLSAIKRLFRTPNIHAQARTTPIRLWKHLSMLQIIKQYNPKQPGT